MDSQLNPELTAKVCSSVFNRKHGISAFQVTARKQHLHSLLSQPDSIFLLRGTLTQGLRVQTQVFHLRRWLKNFTSKAFCQGKFSGVAQFFSSKDTCGPKKRKAFTFMGRSRDRYGGKFFQKVSSRVRKQRAINQGIFPGERI